MSRFFVLVMVNTRTGATRDYFAHVVPLAEREQYGRQLVARDLDGDELDPDDWTYSHVERARPPRPLTI